jgi:hypothetical protein
MKRLLSMSLVLGFLSGCGGGHDDPPPPVASTPAPTPGGSAAPDKFAAQVASVAATQSDDAEPVALDGGAPTLPDDTEPIAVTP